MPEEDHVWSARGCACNKTEVMATAAETALWAAEMGGAGWGVELADVSVFRKLALGSGEHWRLFRSITLKC